MNTPELITDRLILRKFTEKDIEALYQILTRREQFIPHFYKWWDELRLTRRFLDFRILLYYNVFTNQSYLMERI